MECWTWIKRSWENSFSLSGDETGGLRKCLGKSFTFFTAFTGEWKSECKIKIFTKILPNYFALPNKLELKLQSSKIILKSEKNL